MIALRPLQGKIGKKPWTVRENMKIPDHVIDAIGAKGIEALKRTKSIAEGPKRKERETKKVDD